MDSASFRRFLAPCALAAALALGTDVPAAAAQSSTAPDSATEAAHFESHLLDSGHWAVRAAERAVAMGLVAEYLHGQRSVPLRVVGLALREAARNSTTRSREVAHLTASWYRRFTDEFRWFEPLIGGDAPAAALTFAAAGVGAGARSGGVPPGRQDAIADAAPRADGGGFGSVSTVLAAQLGGAVALSATPAIGFGGRGEGEGEWRAHGGDWSASVGAGPLSLRLVSSGLRYGYGEGGGVVLGGNEPIGRVELESRESFRIPGLRFLGPAAFHIATTRLGSARHPEQPWFLSTQTSVQPHPRFDIGINRGFMFGGNGVDITPGLFLNMLIGQQGGSVENIRFANQVAALSFRYRLPTEALLPATLYTEWGMEDGAGAWSSVPGAVIGTFFPFLPGIPAVSAGIEYASFAPACCGNPSWYRSLAFPGNWVVEREAMGHPVGGHGEEAAVYTRADLLDARLFLSGRLFSRRRGEENLLAAERRGQSVGYDFGVAYRIRPKTDIEVSAFADSGAGWVDHRHSLRIARHF